MELNVLFSSVGRRVELVKAFREASNELKIKSKLIGVDMDELAPALNFVDKKYKVPKLSSEEFIPQIIEICKKENVSNQYSKLINYRLDEAALQYLINSDCYYPNEYRRIGRRFKVWSHSFKPALMIVTFFSSINIDFFSKIYANIRKNKISLFKKR